MNRYYSWKLWFLHVNASNLCKITPLLGGNISLPNKIPLVLHVPYEGFPPMTKQVTKSESSVLCNIIAHKYYSTHINE